MNRRDFIALLGGTMTWPVTVRAQQTIPVVGFVVSGAIPSKAAPYVTAFKTGLETVGFIEGQNVLVEYHLLEGHDEGLPAMMAELVRRKVAVIVGDTTPTIAAKKATSTIPILFLTGADPVSLGLVASFNHPGGNATGLTFLTSTLDAKRLELLHKLLPQATVIASFVDPNYPASASQLKDLHDAAGTLDLQLHVLQASDESELDHAFAALPSLHPDALIVSASAFLYARMNQIIELAARNALPAMYFMREFPATGGLISYGASIPDAYRQAGIYTGRILKGQKPAEMPVLQPTKFNLVINLKTAKALGLDVPPSLLMLADEVIE
jgi:putative tryptophan/tyrosine transport system substrate-binding protein